MSKKGIVPAFKPGQYTAYYLKRQPENVLRQEYTRLRDIMQKRYKRLKKAGFNTNFTRAVEMWGEIPKIATIKKMSSGDVGMLVNELAYWISELNVYASSDKTTVKYQRTRSKKLADALQDSGYNISPDEVDSFGDFMDLVRETGADMQLYAETYEAGDTGYRSRRNERTEFERKNLTLAFEYYKKHGYLPDNLIIRGQ